MTTRIRDALGELVEWLEDNDDDCFPLLREAYCQECTGGQTPARFDRGLCPFHRAKRVLRNTPSTTAADYIETAQPVNPKVKP